MNNLLSLTSLQLKRAADLKDKIGALEEELADILGSSANSVAPSKRKSNMSAAGRARIAAAQRARWAKVRRAKAGAKPAARKPGRKSGFSAAAKARLSALAKARWAKAKAAGQKAL